MAYDPSNIAWDETPLDGDEYVAPSLKNIIWDDEAEEEVAPTPAPAPVKKAQAPSMGLTKAALVGGARGLTTELPAMVGGAVQWVGERALPGPAIKPVAETGKALKEWGEKKGEEWFGKAPEEGLERIFYEGAKMLAPSLVPGGASVAGLRFLLNVGNVVKAAKVAKLAGDIAKYEQLAEQATKLAKTANRAASASVAGLFGMSQAQQTADTALKRADQLEAEGLIDEAAKMRKSAEGAAPWITGGIEAAGEYLGTKYLAKLFRLDEGEVLKRTGKQVVKDFLKTLGVEVGTEIGQAAGESGVEKVTGIRPEADPVAEALDVIGPTAFMTIVTGGVGAGANTLLRKEQKKSTDDLGAIEAEKQNGMAKKLESDYRNGNLSIGDILEIQSQFPKASPIYATAGRIIKDYEQLQSEQPIELGVEPAKEKEQELGIALTEREQDMLTGQMVGNLPPAIAPPVGKSAAQSAQVLAQGPNYLPQDMDRLGRIADLNQERVQSELGVLVEQRRREMEHAPAQLPWAGEELRVKMAEEEERSKVQGIGGLAPYLTSLLDLVHQGEPGKRMRVKDLDGTERWFAARSSYPEFMKNKGYTREEVSKAIEKGISGYQFGESETKQKLIWEEALADSRKTMIRDLMDYGKLVEEDPSAIDDIDDFSYNQLLTELRNEGYSTRAIQEAAERHRGPIQARAIAETSRRTGIPEEEILRASASGEVDLNEIWKEATLSQEELEEYYDSQREGRVSRPLGEGQESRGAIPEEGAGRGAAGPGGIFFTKGQKEGKEELTLNTPFGKITGDSATAHAKTFSNLVSLYSSTPQGYNKMDGPTRTNVLSGVLRAVGDPEIFRAVVSSVPVDVMNNLAGEKFSSDDLLGDNSMFISALSSATDPNIVASVVDAVVRSPAISGAERSFRDLLARRPAEVIPAVATGEKVSLEVPGVSHGKEPTSKTGELQAEKPDHLGSAFDKAQKLGPKFVMMLTFAERAALTKAGFGGKGNVYDLDAILEAARARGVSSEPGRPVALPEHPAPGLSKDIEKAANEAATSPTNEVPEPTPAQIEQGNYRKGHITLHGLNISIENPKGSTREGVDKAGKPWRTEMRAHYGYIRRTEAEKDGDQVDVFIGPNPASEKVYVIDQADPKTRTFDEHKILIGWDSEKKARVGYLANYERGWKGIGAVTEYSLEDFKKALFSEEGLPVTVKEPKAKLKTRDEAIKEKIDSIIADVKASEKPVYVTPQVRVEYGKGKVALSPVYGALKAAGLESTQLNYWTAKKEEGPEEHKPIQEAVKRPPTKGEAEAVRIFMEEEGLAPKTEKGLLPEPMEEKEAPKPETKPAVEEQPKVEAKARPETVSPVKQAEREEAYTRKERTAFVERLLNDQDVSTIYDTLKRLGIRSKTTEKLWEDARVQKDPNRDYTEAFYLAAEKDLYRWMAKGKEVVPSGEETQEKAEALLKKEEGKPEDLLPLITSLQRPGQPRELVSISDLRDAANIPYEAFDKALLQLAREGKVALHEHDFASSLTDAERKKLLSVENPKAHWGGRTYYVGVVPKGEVKAEEKAVVAGKIYRRGRENGKWWTTDKEYADVFGGDRKLQEQQFDPKDYSLLDTRKGGGEFLDNLSEAEKDSALKKRGYDGYIVGGEKGEPIIYFAKPPAKAVAAPKVEKPAQGKPLSEITVTVTAIREATGEKLKVESNAQEALDDVNSRIKVCEAMLECLAS